MLLYSKLSWLGKKVHTLKCDHRVYHFIGMGSIPLPFIVCSYNRLGTMPHKATKRNSLVWGSLSTYPCFLGSKLTPIKKKVCSCKQDNSKYNDEAVSYHYLQKSSTFGYCWHFTCYYSSISAGERVSFRF